MHDITQELQRKEHMNAELNAEDLRIELDLITQLQRYWAMMGINKEVPPVTQFQLWLHLHHDRPERLLRGLSKASIKADKYKDEGKEFTYLHALSFISSVMNAQKSEAQEKYMNEMTASEVAQAVLTPEAINYLPRLPLYEAEQKPESKFAEVNGILTPMTQE